VCALVKNYSGRFLKIQEDFLKFRKIPQNPGKLLKKLRNVPEFVWQLQILKIPFASLKNSDGDNSSNFLRMPPEFFFVSVPGPKMSNSLSPFPLEFPENPSTIIVSFITFICGAYYNNTARYDKHYPFSPPLPQTMTGQHAASAVTHFN
jgi:hypothetical protein